MKFGYKAPEDQNYKIILQDTVFAQPRVYVDGLPPKSLSQYYTKKEADTIFVSKNAIPDNITVLGNDVNIPGGLVQIDSKGKIPSELYDSGASYTVGQGIAITDGNQISFNPSTYTEPFYLSSGIDEDNRTYISSGGYQNGIKLGFEADKYLPSIEIRNNLMIIRCSYNSSLTISNNAIYYSNGNHLLAPHVDTPWGTVKSSYVANYGGADASGWINGGNVHDIVLSAGIACTLTISMYYAWFESMIIYVDNSAGGSLLFGEQELIASNETGKYALFFMNFHSSRGGGDNIKCYNKVEI